MQNDGLVGLTQSSPCSQLALWLTADVRERPAYQNTPIPPARSIHTEELTRCIGFDRNHGVDSLRLSGEIRLEGTNDNPSMLRGSLLMETEKVAAIVESGGSGLPRLRTPEPRYPARQSWPFRRRSRLIRH